MSSANENYDAIKAVAFYLPWTYIKAIWLSNTSVFLQSRLLLLQNSNENLPGTHYCMNDALFYPCVSQNHRHPEFICAKCDISPHRPINSKWTLDTIQPHVVSAHLTDLLDLFHSDDSNNDCWAVVCSISPVIAELQDVSGKAAEQSAVYFLVTAT